MYALRIIIGQEIVDGFPGNSQVVRNLHSGVTSRKKLLHQVFLGGHALSPS